MMQGHMVSRGSCCCGNEPVQHVEDQADNRLDCMPSGALNRVDLHTVHVIANGVRCTVRCTGHRVCRHMSHMGDPLARVVATES